jgi:Mce-associated membrane protein
MTGKEIRPVPGSALRSRRTWLGSAFVVALVALAALSIVQLLSVRDHDQLEARRQAAVNAASREVVAFLLISDQTAADDLKALLAGATAQFHDRLEQEATTFKQALASGQVTSTGAVLAAGVSELHGSDARVAVAAKATVKSATTPDGQERTYRLMVSLMRVHERWLVSGLEILA